MLTRHEEQLLSRRNWNDTRLYLQYYEEVKHAVPGTLNMYRTALDHLLRWATNIQFKRAADLRPVLPTYLQSLGTMSESYQTKLLVICRDFFEWGRDRYPDSYPGKVYRETLYPVKDREGGSDENEMQICTLDEMLALAAIPVRNLTEMRDRAAACFLFLSGIRAGAFVTLPLQAFNVERGEIKQWPKLGVATKFRKAATTFFVRTNEVEPLKDVVREWDELVQRSLAPTAPWYTLIDRHRNFASDQIPGKSRPQNLARHLGYLCERAGLEYRSPHKFRHGFAVYGLKLCHDMEEYKIISQNLMHKNVTTTDAIYAKMMRRQVAEAIVELGNGGRRSNLSDEDVERLTKEFFKKLMEQQQK